MVRLFVIATALLAIVSVCGSAVAHVQTDQGNWLFTGSTYSDDQDRSQPPNRDHRSDPVTVVWRGPSGTDATVRRALDHTEEHWTDRHIPDSDYPRGARMRPRSNPFCTDPQFVVFFRSGNQANQGAWAQSRSYMSTNHLCGNQYHVRLWTDYLHGQFFPGAEHQHEFVLAPIHHERVRFRLLDALRLPYHQIDLPWDLARRAYLYALDAHCVEFGWAAHPEADEDYGDFPNSGIISRIGFRHDTEGCTGD